MGLDTRFYVVDPKTDEVVDNELFYARKNWSLTTAVWDLLGKDETEEEKIYRNGMNYRMLLRDVVAIEALIIKSIRNSDCLSETLDLENELGFFSIDDAMDCLKAMYKAEQYIKEGKAVIFEADY